MKTQFSTRSLAYLAALAAALVFAAPATAQQAPAAPGAPEMKDLPLTVEQRQSYVANYRVTTPEGPMIFRIFEDAGVLKGVPGDDEPKRLLYQGENVFRPEGLPGFSITFTMEGAKATKFVVKSPEWTMEGVRVP